jgi:hypothetical protein
MRKAACSLALVLAPSLAHAEEPAASVKIGTTEEIGVVMAGVGGSALVSGAILMGMGFDRRLAPGEVADEIYVGAAIMAAGAVFFGAGIPIAFVGHAKRVEEEKENKQQQAPRAVLVPTFGGAAAVVSF